MIITKCAKRLMATVMTTALVLTGLVVAPKEVSADTTPSVTFKGATLRMYNDTNLDGTQSMRVGIEIANADNVKDCSVTITNKQNDKKFTISTDEAKSTDKKAYKNIYSKSEDGNTLVYTAVIKGIPERNFEDYLFVKGEITTLDDTTKSTSGDDKRTIKEIVNSLGTEYELVNGDLYKTIYNWDFEDGSNPINSNWGNYPFISGATSTISDLNSNKVLEVVHNDGTVKNWDGILVKLPSFGYYKMEFKAKAKDEGAKIGFRNAYNSTFYGGSEYELSTTKWTTVSGEENFEEIKTDPYNGTSDVIKITFSQNLNKSYYIDDFKVIKKADNNDIKTKDIIVQDIDLTPQVLPTIKTTDTYLGRAIHLSEALAGINLSNYKQIEIKCSITDSKGKDFTKTSSGRTYIDGKICLAGIDAANDMVIPCTGYDNGSDGTYSFGINNKSFDTSKMKSIIGINAQVFSDGLQKDESGKVTEEYTITITSIKLIAK